MNYLSKIKFRHNLVLLFSVLVLCLVSVSAHAQTDLVDTTDSLETISQQENKKTLLYFSGSDWCGPCIKFKRDFINQTEFIEYSQENLVIINADFPRKKANQLTKEQTEENEKLAEKYNPKGLFPYILLLDKEGKVIKKWESLPSESLTEFIANLKE